MKKTFCVFFLVLLLTGCVDPYSAPTDYSTQYLTSQADFTQKQTRLKIITSFYPLYEIIHQIGGEKVEVKNLVPAGVEPHDFEPTTQDLISLYKADLIVYNGSGFEPWADKIIPELQKNHIQVLNQSTLVTSNLLHNDQSTLEHHNDEDHEHTSSATDPHFWLDIDLYLKQIQGISQKMIELDPAHKTWYEENTRRYTAEIQELDRNFNEGLQNCQQRTIVTSHAAFAYVAKRYNLEMVPITGINPEGEPSPKVLSDIIKLVKSKKLTGIFSETTVNPKITEVLAKETGAQVFILNPLEGLSPKELAAGENYMSIMNKNLENLKKGLQCQ